MLEYRVNKRNFNKTKEYLDVESMDSPFDFTEGVNEGKTLLMFRCSNVPLLTGATYVNAVNDLVLTYGQEGEITQTYTFDEKYELASVNDTDGTFSIMVDTKYVLNTIRIECRKYEADSEGIDSVIDENVFLYFDGPHYFDVYDDIVVYFRNEHSEGETAVKFKFYEYDTLVTSYDEITEDLFELLFGYAKPTSFDDSRDSEGDLSGVTVLRDRFLFSDKTDYNFWYVKPVVNISIPLTSSFETNLFQTELLNEQFVNAEKEKAVKKIVDIEKDVYYPCVIKTEGENGTTYDDVYTIKFNLHFREHRGENWLVDNESYWNGVHIGGVDKKIMVDDKITADNVSDLLGYLNFTNDDIRYQKNKLKKSFLRLSFYDSTNPANQNLVGYSTVFMNSGEQFSKYARYIDEEGYTMIESDEYGKYKFTPNKTGIAVNREYGVSEYETEFAEEKRLSTQFVIKGKNNSKASSEGFYLYIWKDNESTLPQDLYMRVEFNHAGYGRSIPFMMPYDVKKSIKKSKLKTFKDILDDFTANDKKPYTMKDYLKYSYIHLKYRYDKDKMIHRYYLDKDTYGNIEVNNNELVFNLYEAKLGGLANEGD